MNFKVGEKIAVTDEYVQTCNARGFRILLNPNVLYTVKKICRDCSLELEEIDGQYHFSHFKTAPYNTEEFWTGIGQNTSRDASIVKAIQYKFSEPDYLKELEQYVDSTYSQHYASKGVQTAELIFADAQRGLHYTLSNIVKYADRFGKKDGKNRQDLLKIAHYTIHALHCLDKLEDNNG
ncbi:DUF3310 domain-containing protein [Spartinivicinus marinus]|uniref:DUF3310 domain-containing protein n=1 Tax=Spartinivicinus marinus TaxID=2994442 RepID=UPI0022538F9C|nr:DUF3310 domain-containing protein [Spartinivicinus marinus]MCX4025641.1 DUF3310 domain-containing protein [Spartinivicinus marinus]